MMKVGIQRDNHQIVGSAVLKNCTICRGCETDIADVRRGQPRLGEQTDGGTRQPLIKQQCHRRLPQLDDLIVHARRGVSQRLADVFVFELGVLPA